DPGTRSGRWREPIGPSIRPHSSPLRANDLSGPRGDQKLRNFNFVTVPAGDGRALEALASRRISRRGADVARGSNNSLKGPSRHSARGARLGRPVPADLRGESETLD